MDAGETEGKLDQLGDFVDERPERIQEHNSTRFPNIHPTRTPLWHRQRPARQKTVSIARSRTAQSSLRRRLAPSRRRLWKATESESCGELSYLWFFGHLRSGSPRRRARRVRSRTATARGSM